MGDRGIEIDIQHHPVVIIRFVHASMTEQDVAYAHARLDEVLARQEPFVSISEGGRLRRLPPPRIGRALETWVDRNLAAVQRYSCGNVIVAHNRLARGVARWVLQQRKSRTDGHVVANFDEAVAWAVDRLAQRGVAYNPARLHVSLGDEPVSSPIAPRRGALDPAQQATVEMVLGAFSEAAFLVDPDGDLVFQNAAAAAAFAAPPAWLRAAVSTGHDGIKALCQVVPLELGADAFLVVPSADLVPQDDTRAAPLDLPAGLQPVAALLAQGLSDKEIAAHTDLSLRTVRTYVTRIFKRTGVHSRGAFIRTYGAPLAARSGSLAS